MHLPGRPVAAFDPEGLIFAAGINSESLKLYDLRSFDKVKKPLVLRTCHWPYITYIVRNIGPMALQSLPYYSMYILKLTLYHSFL